MMTCVAINYALLLSVYLERDEATATAFKRRHGQESEERKEINDQDYEGNGNYQVCNSTFIIYYPMCK